MSAETGPSKASGDEDARRESEDEARGDAIADEDDAVDESSRESFPASDPPSFWAGSDQPRRPQP